MTGSADVSGYVEQPQRSGSGLGMFGPHHWPVTLRHGAVQLAPMDQEDWGE